ncbi:hypothetical protein H1R20_g11676, partial [Candolleomyces eurysporus]
MAKKGTDESTTLFAGAHHQSFQGADFRTAGNDIYMPTFNVNFNAPGLLVAPSSPSPKSAPAPSTPKFRKRVSLSRAVQQVSRFFRSSKSQDPQSHPSPSALTSNFEEMRQMLEAVPTHQGQSSTSGNTGVQDTASDDQPSERSSEDFNVVRLTTWLYGLSHVDCR